MLLGETMWSKKNKCCTLGTTGEYGLGPTRYSSFLMQLFALVKE